MIIQNNLKSFQNWYTTKSVVGFDTETIPAQWWPDRKLQVVQFGDYNDQFFFEWNKISPSDKKELVKLIEDKRVTKIGHNIMFDLVALRFAGIYMENVFDTQTAEKVLTTGLTNDFPSLDEVVDKYVPRRGHDGRMIRMNKEYQTSFTGGELGEGQIKYLAEDVQFLVPVYRNQVLQLQQLELTTVMALENDAAIGYAEQMYEGMYLNVPYWLSLTKDTKVLLKAAEDRLNWWITAEENHKWNLWKTAMDNGWYDLEDRIELPLNSPNKVTELLQWLYPGISGSSKPVAAKYAVTHRDNPYLMELEAWAAGDKEPFSKTLLKLHYDRLIEMGYIIPGGKVTLNWNSTAQALIMLRTIVPKLKDLSEETVSVQSHPIFDDYEKFKDLFKNVSSYGPGFVEKHLGPDGKVRTTFNPVMSTGRISSAKPNLQNILANDEVGSKYRNAFFCQQGSKFVDSDYASQELVIIAFISNDPVWNEALKLGQDLHSVCAELVFGIQWKRAAESGCSYYKMEVNATGKLVQVKKKCDCKEHKKLRNAVKTINFGLAYGMSEFKLSRTLSISVQAAKDLIKEYFKVFPSIKRVLDYMGNFAVSNGYIMTRAPFHRKRWFPYWRINYKYTDEHLMGYRYNSALGSIERQGKNTPIQGTAADMMKLAMCMIRWYRDDNNLRDKIALVVQVHDQQTTRCVDELCEWWKPKMTALMEEAGRVLVTSGLLRAETNISQLWTK
jgi:DNA polymerase I-like protein with 3'-5' exonuclease and polymerase domains